MMWLRKRHPFPCRWRFLSALWTSAFFLCVRGCQLFQQLHRVLPAGSAQAVVCPFPLLTADNNSRVTEDFHVV